MEILSMDKILWLEELFFEREVSREEFEQLKTAEELHRVVEQYNWGEGRKLMQWVIESPLCDKGTALLVFWRNGPIFYTKFSEDPKGWMSDGYKLAMQILDLWENNHFSEGLISYDPIKDFAAETDEESQGAWEIPQSMRLATKGDEWPNYTEMYFPAP